MSFNSINVIMKLMYNFCKGDIYVELENHITEEAFEEMDKGEKINPDNIMKTEIFTVKFPVIIDDSLIFFLSDKAKYLFIEFG